MIEGREGLSLATLEPSHGPKDAFLGEAATMALRGSFRSRSLLQLEALPEAPRLGTRTGPDGRFVLAPLRPGRWHVEGDAKGGPIEAETIDLEDSHSELALTVAGGRIWIAGVVRDCRTGGAIPGAKVVAVARSIGARVMETAETSGSEPPGVPGTEEDPLPESGGFRLALFDRSFA
ncbi:MAG: hypothetical protein ACREIU_04090, partial [Planctomycetota bacterium]